MGRCPLTASPPTDSSPPDSSPPDPSLLDPLPVPRAPWWDGLAPAQMSLDCGGTEHLLRWAEGQLTAIEHPDANRERALVALGGERVACLDLLDAWHRHSDDLDLLVLSSRGPSDRLPDPNATENTRYSGGYRKFGRTTGPVGIPNFRGGSPRNVGRGWTSYSPFDDDHDNVEITADQLANLGGGLTDRLVATILAAWAERIDAGDERVAVALPKLRAALYGRVVATIRGVTREPAVVDLVMVDAPAQRVVTLQTGRVRVELPFSWLSEVWVKDLATILGHLCLSVEETDSDHWQLLVADDALQGQRIMTIDFADATPEIS